jgi:hypothetical protein
MAVTMKNVVIWHMTPCGSRMTQRFGGRYRFHYQVQKSQQARDNISSNQQHPDDGGDIPLKRRFLQEQHDVTSQKTPFFLSASLQFPVRGGVDVMENRILLSLPGLELRALAHGLQAG